MLLGMATAYLDLDCCVAICNFEIWPMLTNVPACIDIHIYITTKYIGFMALGNLFYMLSLFLPNLLPKWTPFYIIPSSCHLLDKATALSKRLCTKSWLDDVSMKHRESSIINYDIVTRWTNMSWMKNHYIVVTEFHARIIWKTPKLVEH